MAQRLIKAALVSASAFMMHGTAMGHDVPMSQGSDLPMEHSAAKPLALVVNDGGDYLEISVVTAAECQCDGRFTLESTAGTGNRSSHSGSFSSATLSGAILTRLRVNHPASWSIKLTVEIDGQEPYSELRSARNTG